MEQLTKEQAIAFKNSNVWATWDARQIAVFQMEQDRLCVPFDLFHKCIEHCLGRPVYTHEFALNRDGLRKELNGEQEPPTLDEIINLIPEDKQIIIMQ